MATLYCPTCGYNLTGLPENRCPECGNPFDPIALEHRLGDPVQPISRREIVLRCAGIALGFWLTVPILLITEAGALLIFAAPVVVLLSAINARDTARRLVVNRAVRDQQAEVLRMRPAELDRQPGVNAWSALLLFVQLAATLLMPPLLFAILMFSQ